MGYKHINLLDESVTVMKKNLKIKHLMTCMLASVLTISMLTGCQYRITDKTVEEEVAEALAEASGRELGRVMALQEGYQDTSVQHRSVNAAAFKEEAAMDSAAEMAVMPGELSVDASVTVTYELK